MFTRSGTEPCATPALLTLLLLPMRLVARASLLPTALSFPRHFRVTPARPSSSIWDGPICTPPTTCGHPSSPSAPTPKVRTGGCGSAGGRQAKGSASTGARTGVGWSRARAVAGCCESEASLSCNRASGTAITVREERREALAAAVGELGYQVRVCGREGARSDLDVGARHLEPHMRGHRLGHALRVLIRRLTRAALIAPAHTSSDTRRIDSACSSIGSRPRGRSP